MFSLFKFTKEVKAKWLAALRSGQYKQSHDALCETDRNGKFTGFCCLGVLGDTLIADNPKAYWADQITTSFGPGGYDGGFRISRQRGLIPTDIIELPELSSELDTHSDCTLEQLAYLNDDEGKDFNFIADYIEQHLIPVDA